MSTAVCMCTCGHPQTEHIPRVSSDWIECNLCDGNDSCEGWYTE